MHLPSEQVGARFDRTKFESARSQTWRALNDIAQGIEAGMLEADAKEQAESTLKQMGVQRLWHKTHVRFGINTLKTFSETSLPGVRLQKNDLFFIDIGPVWDNHEGDAGATFVLGNDPQMQACAADCRTIFTRVRHQWKETGQTGAALYAFAELCAKEAGWLFNQEVGGHRLSDFPHLLHHKGSLREEALRPSTGYWVLEIQIRHPDRPFGAFYEDLLI